MAYYIWIYVVIDLQVSKRNSLNSLAGLKWKNSTVSLNTLKEHQKFLANVIFQKFLISMVVYEKSIIFP